MEMQIKLYITTLIWMLKIKKNGHMKCWWNCKGTGILIHYWWLYKIIHYRYFAKYFGNLIFKTINIWPWSVPKVIFLYVYPKEKRDISSKWLIATLFLITKIYNQHKCSSTGECKIVVYSKYIILLTN